MATMNVNLACSLCADLESVGQEDDFYNDEAETEKCHAYLSASGCDERMRGGTRCGWLKFGGCDKLRVERGSQ